jgi:effector-binding domain-containing protein
MLKAFGITIALLGIIAGIMVYRTGIYKEVTIASGQMGPYVFVFNEHIGPYHKIVPVIESIEKFMADNNMPCALTFGRYFDDPDKVEHDRLRSHGGCAFTQMTPELQKLIEEGKFDYDNVEQQEYVIARFNGSPSVGPFVVYPKIESWFEKYGYQMEKPVVELYQILPDQSVLTSYLFKYHTN